MKHITYYYRSVENFDEILSVSKFDTQDSKFVKRKITSMCIRTSYYIFCKLNKEWKNPAANGIIISFLSKNNILVNIDDICSVNLKQALVNYLLREVYYCNCICTND